jgi:hypothetical protein
MLDPSLKKKLLHEDRWSRTYEAGENFYAAESKLDADGLSFSIGQLRSEWDSWDDSEKIRFVNAFRSKSRFSKSDEPILEFLMESGNEPVWSTIASCLAVHHTDKQRVLAFLLEKIKSFSEPKSNLIQALYVLGDAAALPALHQLHDELRESIKRTHDVDHWKINDFLRSCEALAYMEKGDSYRDEIRQFLRDPDELVRLHARNALAGPQREEFGDS